ncbi:MAG: hypothetical protein QM679_05820 [Patulibacter sp.]
MSLVFASAGSADASLWSDVMSVIGYGLVAGIGIAVLFSLALRGLIDAATARRAGQRGAALVWGGVGVLGAALCLAVVALGLVTMLHR